MGRAGPSRGEHAVECDKADIQPPSDEYQQHQRGPHGAEQHWSHIGKPSGQTSALALGALEPHERSVCQRLCLVRCKRLLYSFPLEFSTRFGCF